MALNDIDELGEKIQQATPQEEPKDPELENKREGLQAGAELVGAIIGGLIAGIALDKWLGTAPLFLLIGLFLGFVVALYNIYRITKGYGSTVGFYDLQEQAKKDKKGADLEKEKPE